MKERACPLSLYLIDVGDCVIWDADPNPYGEPEPPESVQYVRADRITALESALSDCVRHMKTAGSPEAVRACEAAERLLGVER